MFSALPNRFQKVLKIGQIFPNFSKDAMKNGEPKPTIRFAGFEIDAARRRLAREGETITLNAKAFDLLVFLAENAGRVVSKDEILDAVWGGQFVEEANLTVQMSAIRKALGERKDAPRFLATIPGKGYEFIADIQPNGDELIIEKHKLERVLIEDSSEPAAVAGGLDSITKKLNLGIPVFGILAVILIAVAGGFVFRYYNSPPPNNQNRAALPFADARIKQLTTKGKVGNVAISPDGKFYAYTLNERSEYKNSLWFGQTDGGSDIQLRPPDEDMVRGIAFSPDGKTLYFSLTGGENGQGGLFKMRVLGGIAEKLLDNVRAYFALSPDGKQIAFFRASKDRDASTALVIANMDGAGEREITTRPHDKNFSSLSPAWSPDGSLIAVGMHSDGAKLNEDVFVVRVLDGHIEQLTAFEWFDVSNLIWWRDGQGIIVNATSKSEGKLRHLWHIDYPAGNATKLSQDTDSYSSVLSLSSDSKQLLTVQLHRESNIWIAPSDDIARSRQITFSAINGFYGWNGFDWTADGRIVFSAGVDNSIAIYSMNADGTGIRQITSAGFFDQKPSVTADGSFIVFQSNRSGGSEIWRVKSDGSNLRQLTTGGGNSAPHVTPDGKWVIYISTREGKNFLSRISIEGGDSTRITDKATSADPRVSPDGRFIACGYKRDEKSPTQLAIVSIEDGKPVKSFDIPRTANLNQSFRWMPDGKAVCYRDGVNGIWKQDLSGGQPKRLEDLPEEKLYNFGWSANGKIFAYVRGREITDAVLIKNFN
jgi:Tol biopolymer transport system component/DNA-binding winged helix-turn-helix (wHTH) protein